MSEVEGQPVKSPRKEFRARPCPVCSKLSIEKFRPFCSARCADVDLNRWLSGGYGVPVVELEPEDLAELAEIGAGGDGDR